MWKYAGYHWPRGKTPPGKSRGGTRGMEREGAQIVVPRAFRPRFANKMATNEKDQAVLESIFNPLLPLGDVAPKNQNENEINDENTEDAKQAKQLEESGVEKAEQGDLDGALECFNQACEICSSRPSCFNNRAQLWRLKGDVSSALEDLNKAVELSGGRGAAAAQAYTQRGLIHRLNGEDDKALEDFTKATKLGSAFAKTMVVQMNPYAAMCNKMLADAINKLRGEPQ